MGMRGIGRDWTRVRALSFRIPKVPSGDFFRSRSLGGAALIIAALVLAASAQHLSESEALLRWKREAAPALPLWRQVLRSYGFQEQTDPAKAHPDLRTLPLLAGSEAQAWIRSDRSRIAVFEGQRDGEDPRIFFREKAPEQGRTSSPPGTQKPGWRPLGRGWDAIDTLVSELNREPERPDQHGSPAFRHKVTRFHDPRELIY